MRDRIIIAVCVLGVVGLFAGIAVFGPHEGQAGDQATNPATRPPGGPAASLGLSGPFFKLFFDPDYPYSGQSVNSASRVATARASLSPAGAAAPAPAARPAVIQAPPPQVCAPSLLGSVVGLLGGLIGGGGGC